MWSQRFPSWVQWFLLFSDSLHFTGHVYYILQLIQPKHHKRNIKLHTAVRVEIEHIYSTCIATLSFKAKYMTHLCSMHLYCMSPSFENSLAIQHWQLWQSNQYKCNFYQKIDYKYKPALQLLLRCAMTKLVTWAIDPLCQVWLRIYKHPLHCYGNAKVSDNTSNSNLKYIYSLATAGDY